MKVFLTSRLGAACVAAFALLMAFAFWRVAQRRSAREVQASAVRAAPAPVTPKDSLQTPVPSSDSAAAVAENAAYLDQFYALGARESQRSDRQGNPVTHRENPSTPSDAARTVPDDEPPPTPRKAVRTSLRLSGRASRRPAGAAVNAAAGASASSPPVAEPASPPGAAGRVAVSRPLSRFNPYGRVIKCELVFTIDSTLEETPLVGVVTDPVYNNGALVIPAGAELHGVARPDRLRDRIFSGQQWVLVLPRERNLPNGRQLAVKGVALDRVEPDANGMTWGITDGSFGLQGRILRTLENEAVKRFVATFIAAGALGLQDRQSDRSGRQSVPGSPRNAVLQGLAANLEKMAQDVAAEIARHGVFIRVPAGHQFYFYPMQIIDADAAEIVANAVEPK